MRLRRREDEREARQARIAELVARIGHRPPDAIAEMRAELAALHQRLDPEPVAMPCPRYGGCVSCGITHDAPGAMDAWSMTWSVIHRPGDPRLWPVCTWCEPLAHWEDEQGHLDRTSAALAWLLDVRPPSRPPAGLAKKLDFRVFGERPGAKPGREPWEYVSRRELADLRKRATELGVFENRKKTPMSVSTGLVKYPIDWRPPKRRQQRPVRQR